MLNIELSGNNEVKALPTEPLNVVGYNHVHIIAVTKSNITGDIQLQGSYDNINWVNILSTFVRPDQTYSTGSGFGKLASPNNTIAQSAFPTLGYSKIRLNGNITFPNLATATKLIVNVYPFQINTSTASVGGGGGIADLVDDTSPQLGGNLDLNGHSIIGVIPAAGLDITNPTAAVTPLIVRTALSQSVDSFQIKNNSGTTIFKISKDGGMSLGLTGGVTSTIAAEGELDISSTDGKDLNIDSADDLFMSSVGLTQQVVGTTWYAAGALGTAEITLDNSAGTVVVHGTAGITFTGPVTLNGVTLLPTGTELNFVDGVTSAIQTQLDSKYSGGGALGTPASGNGSNLTALNATNISSGTLNAARLPTTTVQTTDTGTVTDKIGALQVKPAVAVVSVANLTLSGEQTIDGILTSSSLVLATAQSSGAQNGPWVSAAGAWTRPTWYTSASVTQAPQFLTTFVRLGTTYSGSTWRMTTASVTIDTTSTTWAQTPISLASSNVTGTLSGSSISGGTLGATAGTNLTGTAASLTAGNVTTNANLTGHVTSTGNAAVLGSFTSAQLSTAVSDDNPAYVGAANTFSLGQTFSSAITYGGVALSNSVTGTGSMVLSASPTFTGTLTASTVTASASVQAGATSNIRWTASTTLNTQNTAGTATNGWLTITNTAATGLSGVILGDNTTSYPALVPSGSGGTLGIKLASDGTTDAPLTASNITASGTHTVVGASTLTGLLTVNGGITYGDAQNCAYGSTTGTKLGTATSQKIGFWNATPIIQPAGAAQVAPATYATGVFGLDSNANMQALYDLVVAMRTAMVNAGLIKGAA